MLTFSYEMYQHSSNVFFKFISVHLTATLPSLEVEMKGDLIINTFQFSLMHLF